jgi:predicted nucleotidyltransferase
MSENPIIELFASKTLVRVLSVLLAAPDTWLYQQQIVRRAGGQLHPVQVALKKLEVAGLLSVRRDGRQAYYRAEERHPVFKELRSLFMKTFALADVLRDALNGTVGIELAFVFGSVAAGEETAGSDVDLFVVGDVRRLALAPALGRAEEMLGRQVNAAVYTRGRLREAVHGDDHFVSGVLHGPMMWVIGDEDGLQVLVG